MICCSCSFSLFLELHLFVYSLFLSSSSSLLFSPWVMATNKWVVKYFYFCPSSPLPSASGPREENQPAEGDVVLSASSGHGGPAVRPDGLLPHSDRATNHDWSATGTRTYTTKTRLIFCSAACLLSAVSGFSALCWSLSTGWKLCLWVALCWLTTISILMLWELFYR